MHSESLQHACDASLGIPQGLSSLLGNLNKILTEATPASQRAQLLSNTGNKLFIPPQIDGASSSTAAKTQTPITVMSVTTIILSEISLLTKGV
jgi:hypothetical protein